MEVKPILFSTPMVQAILDGRKTMTRRVIKAQPYLEDGFWRLAGGGWSSGMEKVFLMPGHSMYNLSPYKPGDILWVRETWCDAEKYFGPKTEPKFYYATNQTPESERCRKDYGIPWRPSIFMPREACRLFLRVTAVRAERLQEITATDAVHEGIARHGLHSAECYAGGCYNGDFETACAVCDVPREGFRNLWDSLNAKRGYVWNTNPWVWVYSFERCEMPEGWCE